MAYLNAFDAGLRPALNAIDDVARLLADSRAGVQLPKIAVVGDQSSGKSSLLESIFGFSLPRGEDIVTRTPIQVEHRHSKGEEYAVLSYRPPAGASGDDGGTAGAAGTAAGLVERRIANLDGIEAAVREATNAVAGSDKGIVDSTIFLRVHSARNPDLTVLDLPGITRNPVQGQPENVEEIVTSMINRHLAGSMTVILCVIPATVDFSTAAAIKLAKQHDPERKRTMGVVTKIDTVEPGVDVVSKIRGSGANLQLSLGFIPVRNRTAAELRERVPLSAVRDKERAFFAGSQQLAGLPASRRGMDALVQQLVQVQLECVCIALPKLKEQVLAKLEESRGELRRLDDTVVGSEAEAQLRAMQGVVKLGTLFYQLRQADYSALQSDFHVPALAAYRLKVPRHVSGMGKEYIKQVDRACRVSWFLGDECFQELREGARDFSGVTLPNFLSHPLFRSVFLQRVQQQLEGPAMELVGRVQAYVDEVVGALLDSPHLFGHFPRLAVLLKEHAAGKTLELAGMCRQQIRWLVQAQKYIQTHNHYFADTLARVKAEVTAERARRKFAKADPFAVPPTGATFTPGTGGLGSTPAQASKAAPSGFSFGPAASATPSTGGAAPAFGAAPFAFGAKPEPASSSPAGASANAFGVLFGASTDATPTKATNPLYDKSSSPFDFPSPAENVLNEGFDREGVSSEEKQWAQRCKAGTAPPPLPSAPAFSTLFQDEDVGALASRESNEDQGTVEMQITLFSYAKVVIKRVADNVALAVRAMLVEQFGEELAACLQAGVMESAAAAAAGGYRGGAAGDSTGDPRAGLLLLMADPTQVRQRQDMQAVVESLEKAAQRLRNIAL